MNPRENRLRAIRFEKPESIPMSFHINAACWRHYEIPVLQDLMAGHPQLFPHYRADRTVAPHYGLNQRQDAPYTDPWGCVWETTEDGITGSVHQHPLADWSAFAQYQSPDPNLTDGTYPINWSEIEAQIACDKHSGELVCGGLPHGHTFLRLQDIRGYENLLYDMADQDARLPRLIDLVADFNHAVVLKWLQLQPDMMSYAEDLGMQVGPMLSPDYFRTFIKPVYRRLMKPARANGCIVHMHSDGDIRALVDDLIENGVEVINLQDLVNGIDWITAKLANRVCVDLDVDRQSITAHGTPAQIDALIREEVTKIGSPQGGLMMVYGLYPGVPVANVKALMDAMEKYAGYHS